MFRKLAVFSFVVILFGGCAVKSIQKSKSAVIIFQTPVFKFYDKGFVNIYKDHINLQVFEAGHLALNLYIYEDKVCQSSFECMGGDQFNKKYLHPTYKKDFLYNLFLQDSIYHKDRKNGIFIKVRE
jgi:hypothetical protein